jgi:2,3-bisphosphoglycerate-dependent phosphoglycerate mutase
MPQFAPVGVLRRETSLTRVSGTRLVLIRHGESNATVRRVIGGPRTCSGLSPLGQVQSERLRDRFLRHNEIPADALISSSFPRALETAQIIAPGLGSLPISVLPQWGEHDPGPQCDGMTYKDFIDLYGMPDWETDPHAVTFPGGETVAEFHLRVGAALADTVRTYDGATVVVTCHGGVIDAILRTALRAPTTGFFEVHTLNTSITEVQHLRAGRWKLLRYNDAGHLSGLPESTPPHVGDNAAASQ